MKDKTVSWLGNLLISFLIALGVIVVYLILHEGGHAVFAVALGGRVTNFSINFLSGSPHVRYTGDLASWKSAIIALAGPLVPYLFWLVGIKRVNNNSNIIVKKIAVTYSLMTLGTFIPTIILSLLHETGRNLMGEDIVKFIIYSGMNSYLVAVIAAIALVWSVVYLCKRINVKETMKQELHFTIKSKGQQLAAILGVVLCGGVLLGSSINMINVSSRASSMNIPKEYDNLITINLSEEDYYGEIIYNIEVTEAKMYSFYITGNSKEKISLALKGDSYLPNLRSNEMELVDFQGGVSGIYSGWHLKEGEYTFSLSSEKNKGVLNIYTVIDEVPDYIELFSNENIFNGKFPPLPEGYELVVQEDLTHSDNKELYKFSLDVSKDVEFSIFLTTEEGWATVTLLGDGIEDQLINDYQVFTNGRRAFLNKGDYTLRLSSEGCDGEIYLFIKK